jgi:hypothetical protein
MSSFLCFSERNSFVGEYGLNGDAHDAFMNYARAAATRGASWIVESWRWKGLLDRAVEDKSKVEDELLKYKQKYGPLSPDQGEM